jgi:5'-deoxynucleotidase YfbR-like HD superfamily hydrolase
MYVGEASWIEASLANRNVKESYITPNGLISEVIFRPFEQVMVDQQAIVKAIDKIDNIIYSEEVPIQNQVAEIRKILYEGLHFDSLHFEVKG